MNQKDARHRHNIAIMARGNVGVYKVFYKGETDDFVVYVDDVASVKQWRKDKTVPLAQVVSGWKIFITHRYVVLYLPVIDMMPAS